MNCIEVEKNNKELLGNNIIDKIYNVFIKGQENNITNFEIKRLKNEEAIDYYKNYIKYNKKSLNLQFIFNLMPILIGVKMEINWN